MSKSNLSMHTTKHLPVKQYLRLMLVDDHEIVRHGLREVINTIKGFTIVAESRFTVGKHIQNILRKLGVTNRTQVTSYTSSEGEV